MKKQTLIKKLESYNFPKTIIEAFKRVNREVFVSNQQRLFAYEDRPLVIEKGQTISQPSTIAFMLTLLEIDNNQKILEVGSGSGYVLALMNQISDDLKLFGIEVIKELVDKSKKRLDDQKNIKIINKNGRKGLKEEAPFDRIIVSASSSEVPKELINQLKSNGIMLVPVKDSIFKVKKKNNEINVEEFPGFVFVPLI